MSFNSEYSSWKKLSIYGIVEISIASCSHIRLYADCDPFLCSYDNVSIYLPPFWLINVQLNQ